MRPDSLGSILRLRLAFNSAGSQEKFDHQVVNGSRRVAERYATSSNHTPSRQRRHSSLYMSQLACYYGRVDGRYRSISPGDVRILLGHVRVTAICVRPSTRRPKPTKPHPRDWQARSGGLMVSPARPRDLVASVRTCCCTSRHGDGCAERSSLCGRAFPYSRTSSQQILAWESSSISCCFVERISRSREASQVPTNSRFRRARNRVWRSRRVQKVTANFPVDPCRASSIGPPLSLTWGVRSARVRAGSHAPQNDGAENQRHLADQKSSQDGRYFKGDNHARRN